MGRCVGGREGDELVDLLRRDERGRGGMQRVSRMMDERVKVRRERVRTHELDVHEVRHDGSAERVLGGGRGGGVGGGEGGGVHLAQVGE